MADPITQPSIWAEWGKAAALGAQAIFTWWLVRMSTRKTVATSDESTKKVVNEAAAAQALVIAAQTEVIKAQSLVIGKLEKKVEDTRVQQVTISQKHTETMNEACRVMKTFELRKDDSISELEQATSDKKLGDTVVIEDPEKPHGKVTWKP